MDMIAFCGLDCQKCPAYLATIKDDGDLREITAREWSEMYHSDIQPKDIHCRGCQSREGLVFQHCKVCEIRSCGFSRGVTTCAECHEYACDKLKELFVFLPKEKEIMDARNKAFRESE